MYFRSSVYESKYKAVVTISRCKFTICGATGRVKWMELGLWIKYTNGGARVI